MIPDAQEDSLHKELSRLLESFDILEAIANLYEQASEWERFKDFYTTKWIEGLDKENENNPVNEREAYLKLKAVLPSGALKNAESIGQLLLFYFINYKFYSQKLARHQKEFIQNERAAKDAERKRQEELARLQKEEEERRFRAEIQREKLEKARIEEERMAEVLRRNKEAFELQQKKLAKEAQQRAEAEKRKKDAEDELLALLEDQYLNAERMLSDKSRQILGTDGIRHMKIRFIKRYFLNRLQIEPSDEQAEAIGAVGQNVLLTARAGSGKTTVLVWRTYFLVNKCNANPEEIFLFVFNKKAKEEIQKRLARFNIKANVYTFHAAANSLFEKRNILVDSELNNELSEFIKSLILDLRPNKQLWAKVESIMYGSLTKDLSPDRDPSITRKNKQGLDGRLYKSHGERCIANYFFEREFRYKENPNLFVKYEWTYFIGKTRYRPDFVFREKTPSAEYNDHLVIEYFGMKGFSDEYDRLISVKKSYWKKKKVKFLELYKQDIATREYEEKINSSLRELGIEVIRLSKEKVLEKARKVITETFISLIKTFIGRIRKQALSPSQFSSLISSHSQQSEEETELLSVVSDIYKQYCQRLNAPASNEEKKIDFDKLLFEAIELLLGNPIKTDYDPTVLKSFSNAKYVMVDEGQDISFLFNEFIKAVLTLAGGSEVFIVGDNWQAINGFAGSNLKYFDDPQKWLNLDNLLRLNLLTNRRSGKAVVDVGNSIMHGQGEPSRVGNPMESVVYRINLDELRVSEMEAEIIRSLPVEKNDLFLITLIHGILSDDEDSRLLILFYTRDAADNFREIFQKLFGTRWFNGRGNEDLPRIEITTTHQSKGKERGIVILADAFNSNYPKIHPTLPFFGIFGDNEETVINEGRRLFYVGMTRAIETLYVISNSDKEKDDPPSEFLKTARVTSTFKNPYAVPFYKIKVSVDPSVNASCVKQMSDIGYQFSEPDSTFWRYLPVGYTADQIEKEKQYKWPDALRDKSYNISN